MTSQHDDNDKNRPHSIDLMLELERQLENDSPPSSPTASARPHSLDPNILASLIKNLRLEVTALTKERDGLSQELETSKEREEQLREEVHRMMDSRAVLDDEMDALRHKNQEAEDSIALLRSKVEDSRRALMRLQTENRRSSMHAGGMSIDVTRASSFTFGGPASASKRHSFAPLTGTSAARGHQRNPSGTDITADMSRTRLWNPNDVVQDGASLLAVPSTPADYPESAPHSPRSPLPRVETEALQKEIHTLKEALEETRSELAEANEAREASDACAKALRDFIAEHNVGQHTPPEVPARLVGTENKVPAAASRWGFGLWQSAKPSGDKSSAQSPELPAQAPPANVTTSNEPLTKKIGGFFNTRRMSSLAMPAPLPPDFLSSAPSRASGTGSSSSSLDSPEPLSPLEKPLGSLPHVELPGAVDAKLSASPVPLGDGGVEIVQY